MEIVLLTVLIAALAGTVGVWLLNRTTDWRTKGRKMALDPKPHGERRNSSAFALGLWVPLVALEGALLGISGESYLPALLPALWVLVGLVVNFVRNAVPVDPGQPRSSLLAGCRCFVLALTWPVATVVLPRA